MSVCLSSEGSLWTATRALGSGGCGNRELLQPRERLAPAALRAPACVACLFRPGAYLLFFYDRTLPTAFFCPLSLSCGEHV
jgi:hypothetical protein